MRPLGGDRVAPIEPSQGARIGWKAGSKGALKERESGSIVESFRDHGIEMPFPQRDLHLRSVDTSVISTFSKAGLFSARGGSPAWIRTTITISLVESVTYRFYKGRDCLKGHEMPRSVQHRYSPVVIILHTPQELHLDRRNILHQPSHSPQKRHNRQQPWGRRARKSWWRCGSVTLMSAQRKSTYVWIPQKSWRPWRRYCRSACVGGRFKAPDALITSLFEPG